MSYYNVFYSLNTCRYIINDHGNARHPVWEPLVMSVSSIILSFILLWNVKCVRSYSVRYIIYSMREFSLSTFQISFDHGPPQPPRVPVYLSFEREGCTGPSLNSFSVQRRVQPLVFVLVPCRSLTTTHDPLSFWDEHVTHFIQMYKIHYTHTHTCALPDIVVEWWLIFFFGGGGEVSTTVLISQLEKCKRAGNKL